MKYSKLFWAIVCLAKILIIWKKSRILKDNQAISIESLVHKHCLMDYKQIKPWHISCLWMGSEVKLEVEHILGVKKKLSPNKIELDLTPELTHLCGTHRWI